MPKNCVKQMLNMTQEERKPIRIMSNHVKLVENLKLERVRHWRFVTRIKG